jgi:hypothetical protein
MSQIVAATVCELSGRGAGFDDLDGDGDLDIVILTPEKPTLLRWSPNEHH